MYRQQEVYFTLSIPAQHCFTPLRNNSPTRFLISSEFVLPEQRHAPAQDQIPPKETRGIGDYRVKHMHGVDSMEVHTVPYTCYQNKTYISRRVNMGATLQSEVPWAHTIETAVL